MFLFLLSFSRYFFKSLIVISSYSAHYSVPKSKIQTIVAFKILMVLIMVHGSIDPFSKPMFVKTPWIQFVSKMTINIIHDHYKEKDEQMKFMDRNSKKKYDKNSYFHNRF